MEPHKAIFQVIEKETYISQYYLSGARWASPENKDRPPAWKYKCQLLDGPHAGRFMWIYRKKGLNELELGNKYAGVVTIAESPKTWDEDMKVAKIYYNVLSVDKRI